MATSKKSSDSIMLLILIALLGGAWMGVGHVTSQLNMLPIADLPKLPTPNTTIDIKKLYPVLVEFITKKENDAHASDEQIDAAFSQEKKEVAPVAAPIDYVLMLRQSMQLQAVTNNGAIINGRFVQLNDLVMLPNFLTNEVKVKPRLVSIDMQSATVSLGKTMVLFKLQK